MYLIASHENSRNIAIYLLTMESEVDKRRMIFAAAFLPQNIPHYWDIVVEFANENNPGKSRITK